MSESKEIETEISMMYERNDVKIGDFFEMEENCFKQQSHSCTTVPEKEGKLWSTGGA